MASEPGLGLGPGQWTQGPVLPHVSHLLGGLERGGVPLPPAEREGARRQGLQPPLGGARLTLPGRALVSSYFSLIVTGSKAKGGRGLSWPLACSWSSEGRGSYWFAFGGRR